jgi:hypothetical protein
MVDADKYMDEYQTRNKKSIEEKGVPLPISDVKDIFFRMMYEAFDEYMKKEMNKNEF